MNWFKNNKLNEYMIGVPRIEIIINIYIKLKYSYYICVMQKILMILFGDFSKTKYLLND